MRITFLRDEIYETEGPGKGPAFPAGSTWDCADDFGDRWLRRAAAERIGNQVPRDGARFVEVTRGRGAGAEAAAEKAAAEKAAAEKA
ncbi:hypothetical protein [Phenylobacterium sp.]|uniref:hypothetical protein n=1 Tax=Phenylobacterium sp. TaxID=1871053 RepID=UPI00301D5C6A